MNGSNSFLRLEHLFRLNSPKNDISPSFVSPTDWFEKFVNPLELKSLEICVAPLYVFDRICVTGRSRRDSPIKYAYSSTVSTAVSL